jgi:cobalt-precorrin-5B (C1)-methyltransferase
MRILPQLPEVCFVEVGDFTGAALRRAVAHRLGRVVFVGMAGKLTKLAAGILMTHYTRSKVDTALLGDITRTAGGPGDLVERVEQANTARHAAELWEEAGILGPAARELCRRAAEVLRRFCAELSAETPGPSREDPPEVQVVMVDFAGRAEIARSP